MKTGNVLVSNYDIHIIITIKSRSPAQCHEINGPRYKWSPKTRGEGGGLLVVPTQMVQGTCRLFWHQWSEGTIYSQYGWSGGTDYGWGPSVACFSRKLVQLELHPSKLVLGIRTPRAHCAIYRSAYVVAWLYIHN